MRNLITALLLISFRISIAQVGIGITTLNKGVALDINSFNSGLFLPKFNDAISVTAYLQD